MNVFLNLADVPKVKAAELGLPMQMLIEKGQGLALLKGLQENEIRDLEDAVWADFSGPAEVRLAVALRFRALLTAFGSRRLKNLLLERGFKVIAAAIDQAAQLPLNSRFGFSTQKLLMALNTATGRQVAAANTSVPFKIAA